MADGDFVTRVQPKAGNGIVTELFLLLDAQAGAGAGVWVPCRGAQSITLIISGIAASEGVTFYGYIPPDGDPDTLPTASDDHSTISSEQTENIILGLPRSDVPWFIKCDQTTAGGSNAVTVLASIDYLEA